MSSRARPSPSTSSGPPGGRGHRWFAALRSHRGSFIGRSHEFRLVKELFHASAERNSARMVLVSGVAGVGKSRLAWEFFKYIDGLAGDVLWHSGRCLSYGEGVSYWALSEMVRARLQISEEDPLDLVAERLRTGLDRWIPTSRTGSSSLPASASCSGCPPHRYSRKRSSFPAGGSSSRGSRNSSLC